MKEKKRIGLVAAAYAAIFLVAFAGGRVSIWWPKDYWTDDVTRRLDFVGDPQMSLAATESEFSRLN